MVCYIFALLMSERWAHPSPSMCDDCWRHQQSVIICLLDFVQSWETGANEVAMETGERRLTSPHECQGRRACTRLSMDPQQDGQGEDSSGVNVIENKRQPLGTFWELEMDFLVATILVLLLYKNWRVSPRISLCSHGCIFAHCFRGN